MSPVALFLFNRPHTTARVFEAIARARPPVLLVVADAPREDRPGEAERCAEARAIIDRVDWPCEVRTDFADHNLGCKHRIASGLNWVFSQVDEAILLEDDCLPQPEFFRFAGQMLARYRDDDRVHMVRGTNLQRGHRFGTHSYYFSRFYNIWGWATWARAWHHYDVDMSAWATLRESDWLEQRLREPHMARLVRHLFDETHFGRVDTWDYQWMLCGWLRDALAIVPAVNLVNNIGHGAGATHTRNAKSHLANVPTQQLDFPLVHPPVVGVHEAADRREWRMVYPGTERAPTRWWTRLRRWLRRR